MAVLSIALVCISLLIVVVLAPRKNGVQAFLLNGRQSIRSRPILEKTKCRAAKTLSIQWNPLEKALLDGLTAGSTTNNDANNNHQASTKPTTTPTAVTTILIVDSNSVRGKDDFRMWNLDLFHQLERLRRRTWEEGANLLSENKEPQKNLHIIVAMDHGSKPWTVNYPGVGLVVFAGPHRTADDVIVQATRYFMNTDDDDDDEKDGANWKQELRKTKGIVQVVVATSDGELKRRCLRANDDQFVSRRKRQRKKGKPQSFQRAQSSNVKVFASPMLVSALKRIETTNADSVGNKNHGVLLDSVETSLECTESDIRWHALMTGSAESISSNLSELSKTARSVNDVFEGGWRSAILADSEQPNQLAIPIFPRITFQELTWHRIVVAELFRLLLHDFEQANGNSKPNMQSALAAYANFYEKHQEKNSSGDAVDTMLLDHRIRHEPFLQHQLLQYLDDSIKSIEADDKSTESADSVLDTQDSVDRKKSPIQEAGIFLLNLVVESPHRSQNEILSRYMNEAPSNLQYTRRQDLADMLKRLAVREKRPGEATKTWHPLMADPSLSSPSEFVAHALVDWNKAPARGRRASRRRSRQQAEDTGGTTADDEALLCAGRALESKWVEKLFWCQERHSV